MQTLASRVAKVVIGACLIFATASFAIGLIGILGVRSTTQVSNEVAKDELATATVTASVGLRIDAVYATGESAALAPSTHVRALSNSALFTEQIPAVDRGMLDLRRLHADDGATEKAGITQLIRQWNTLRSLLNPTSISSRKALGQTAQAAQITRAYQPLQHHIAALIAREQVDADGDQRQAESRAHTTALEIFGSVLVLAVAFAALGWLAIRRLRRAVEPARGQAEFGDTLQLAEDEDEAQQLLQRHLERQVSGSSVTVLNRNNSADRLEAVTALPPGSPLPGRLQHAEPRSCLAVRSGRGHDEDDRRAALLACAVCSGCGGKSTCTPLTVGGEVIGSVLVASQHSYSDIERQQIRDSVGQAAPVLANLRNLAIAELRAATDSLTGLPNKRAVGDSLKRMLAQASRAMSPMSLIVLDLDHFKEINDRFGHPVGDQALAGVGAALQSAIRDSDFAGRNGGEEFAIVLPDTDQAGAVLTAEKIRESIADISLPGLDVSITASVGIAVYPEHATSPERLERLADAALYTAKRDGRDRVEVAASSDDVVALRAAAAEV